MSRELSPLNRDGSLATSSIPVYTLGDQPTCLPDPDSENLKGPVFETGKVVFSPALPSEPVRPFYDHNLAEVTRLRAVVDMYKTKLEQLRDLAAELLGQIDSFQETRR